MANGNIPALIERYEALWRLWRSPNPTAPLDWDRTGIWDPDTGRCINNHYSLSHLMLAAGLLHELTGSREYGTHCHAMADLLASQQGAGFAPYDINTIHWDFNNLAWLSCALLPQAREIARGLSAPGIKGLVRENRNLAGNWLVMRALSRVLRGQLGTPQPKWRHWPEALLRRRLFRADGGIDEFPGRSRPVQYHAYILALLARRFVLTGSLSLGDERRLVKGIEYLLAHVDPRGNANYRGRGQYQLFFEGCANYVLNIMSDWYGFDDQENACRYGLDCLGRQSWPIRSDGLLALVRTDPQADRTGSHYDYHHVTVYNAFDLAWRLLSIYDRGRMDGLPRPRLAPPQLRTGLFPDSGAFFARPPGWLLAIAGGEEMYLADAGLSLSHLGGERGVLFTAPGGPHPARYGKNFGSDQLFQNVFSPLVCGGEGGGLPHFRRGSLSQSGREVLVETNRERWRLRRRLLVDGLRLHFTDDLRAPEDLPLRHIFHWAVPQELALEQTAPGVYLVQGGEARPLAVLHIEGEIGDGLTAGEPFRGPGGVVRPWHLEARGAEDTLNFTLELLP